MAHFVLCLMGDVCTKRKTKVIKSPTGKHCLLSGDRMSYHSAAKPLVRNKNTRKPIS